VGIPYDQLYGTAQAPELAAEGASRRIVHPRGTSTTAPYVLGFTARSLYIENPSGVWYDVEGFAVAPWTWGQIVRIVVPTPTIAIAQRTPNLLTSESHGGDLVVVAYEDALAPALGRILYPPPRDYQRESGALDVTEANTTYAWSVAQAGTRVVPVAVQLVAYASVFLRAQVVVTWEYELTPGGATATFARQAVSPEAPQAPSVDLDFMATRIGENCDVAVSCEVEDGGGMMSVAATLIYYRALP
jgi:hypothetical protein